MKRISDIPSDEWADLSRLLDEVLGLEDAERPAWLQRLSTQAPQMAERIARALAMRGEQRFSDFLAGPLPLAEQMQSAASFVGRRVGPYQIDAPIGRGGMGSVWRARRVDGRYEGTVAVKFLHAAWVGQDAEERFRKEGSILGRLDHPNIARLLDAGILDGSQPYIVLEYVEGDPIDVHCDRHGLRLEERTRLFLEVLAAVAHAHAHLIVHRDIKPANILVTRDGTVKLLDFGIAKLLDDERGSLHGTTAGMMTPLFAAPEQLLGKPALTATDVYALGVVYYLLLTGTHPLAGARSNAELMSAVLTQDPEPASSHAGIGLIRPQALVGDLDTILGKSLKKNPAERYDSAGRFADDIRRFLTHQPIQARPDTLRYRTGKFVRRNRGSVLTAAATALALILTAATAAWQAHTARQERDLALAAERRADSVGEFLTVLVGNIGNSMSPQAIRPQFDHARELVEKQRYDDPLVQANLLRYLSGRYAEFGDYPLAVSLLEEAREALRTVDEPVDSAQLDCSIANFDDSLGRSDEADRHIRRAVAVLTSLGNSVRPQVRADCRVVESYIATSRGENRRAIASARTAVAEVENAGVRLGLQHDTVINALARAEARAGFNGTAVALLRDLRRSDTAQGRDRTLGGWIHGFNEARDLLAGGRIAEAESLASELHASSRQFSKDSEDFHDISLVQGEVLMALARNAEAIPLLMQAVAHDSGPDATLESRLALIEALLRSGDTSAAHRELDGQQARLMAAVERRSSEATDVLRVRALASLQGGDPQAAEALLGQAAPLAVDADGLPSAAARRIAALRAEVALQRGAVGDACRFAEAAAGRAREEAVDATSSAWTGEALLLHARCNAAAGRMDGAREDARLAQLQLEPNLGHDHPLTRLARSFRDGTDGT